MTKRAKVTQDQVNRIDNLPLFADDASISGAVLGPNRASEWSQIATLLEARGLPTIDTLMGGRYVPAVKAFFDHLYGLNRGAAPSLAPDGTEDFDNWRRNQKHRA
jgi:hypothetical protein